MSSLEENPDPTGGLQEDGGELTFPRPPPREDTVRRHPCRSRADPVSTLSLEVQPPDGENCISVLSATQCVVLCSVGPWRLSPSGGGGCVGGGAQSPAITDLPLSAFQSGPGLCNVVSQDLFSIFYALDAALLRTGHWWESSPAQRSP